MIFAGKLRHQVTLQALTAGSPQQHPSGEPDEDWGNVATCYASIEPLNGRELFAAQEYHSDITVRIRMRYRSGVSHVQRVTHGGKIYNVHAVIDPEERHIELQLLCGEGLNGG